MSAVIRAEGLSKRYLLDHRQAPAYGTLRDALAQGARRAARRLTRPRAAARPDASGEGASEPFWALRDLSFEIAQGERVGIVGRNGAGKSTLLKILSRITEPTAGRVELRGRVASLLEVGTGFHPELTGRENVFLNGAILGMGRPEIARKFDEIVAFAEVERFLDTPVKHYSTGMHARLAFAVAAHLDSEVLIVDEVLAVGDRQFQDRCLGRMEALSSREGRTVLFVSHDLDAIQRLCRSALVLREGRLAFQGDVADAVTHYIASALHAHAGDALDAVPGHWGSGLLRISGLQILGGDGGPAAVLRAGDDYEFVLSYAGRGPAGVIEDGRASLALADSRGTTVLLVSSDFASGRLELDRDGGRIGCRVRDLALAPGRYTVTLFLGRLGGEVLDCLNDAVDLTVAGGDYFGTGHPGLPQHCSTLTRSTWGPR